MGQPFVRLTQRRSNTVELCTSHMAQIANHISIYLPNYVQCEEGQLCPKSMCILAFRKDE